MKQKIYTIYRATNTINGKVYIGFDSDWPKRKNEHLWSARRGDNTAFYNAIRKYGAIQFEWDIIYQSTDGPHTKDVMEEAFIREYQSHIHFENGNGYNMTLGGEGTFGYTHTQESKDMISNSNTGKSVTTATREKISVSKKGKSLAHSGSFLSGHQSWNKGKTMTPSYSETCAKAQKKRFQDPQERAHLNKILEKGRKTLQEKAKIEIILPNGTKTTLTPGEFSKQYHFNIRTVYWNISKYPNKKIVAGVLAGYTLIPPQS